MKNRTNRTSKPKTRPSSKARTRTGAWKEVFLGALFESGNVTWARKAANVSRDTLYATKAKDKAFAAKWGEALEDAVDLLKAEARRRAVEGVDIPVTHEGELAFVAIGPDDKHVPKEEAYGEDGKLKRGYKLVPFVKKQYSDALLQLLLKSGRPSEFGDKVHLLRDIPEPEPIVLVHAAPPEPSAK